MQVGVNKYVMEAEEQNFEILKIDNREVRDKQIKRLNSIKASRDSKAVE